MQLHHSVPAVSLFFAVRVLLEYTFAERVLLEYT